MPGLAAPRRSAVATPWAGLLERLEERRERAALRAAGYGGRGLRERVSSARERVEDGVSRRREAHSRTRGQRTRLPIREVAVETGSPSRASYIAANVMVAAATVALLVVLLGI